MSLNLKVNSISKIYRSKKVLNNVSFELNKGNILGLIGKNGAGKSTVLKILSSLIDFGGDVLINKKSIKKMDAKSKKQVGYLSENNPLYMDFYITEYLNFIGNLNGLFKDSLQRRKKVVIELCGLKNFQNEKIKNLSKGYRQRVGIASAFIHDPDILILDEPTTGLDPSQILEIRELIKNLAKNKIVIFSSHLLNEINEICNKVIFLDKGNIVLKSNIKELKNRYNNISLDKIFNKIIPN
tara:strand:+ start:4521 stop:5240 length:720 start_codon:yes stop_codon:yes gene_type:complete